MSRYLLLLLLGLSLTLATRRTQAEPVPPLDFAVIGDPQIGYGVGGVWGTAERFTQLLARLNERGVRHLVIPGDLVQSRNWLEHWALSRALKSSRAELLLAPGNHDVVDVSSLDEYRRRYGPDYYVRQAGGATFVVVDSETARTAQLSEREFREQWAFLERALIERAGPAPSEVAGVVDPPLFLVTHRPPFVETEDEGESDANWPPATRARLLSLCRRARVTAILAGHLHRSQTVSTGDGIEVRVLCGSARCFDASPIGFAQYESGQVRLVNVAPPPPVPVSVPHMHQWTPRLFDFSLRHWLFTVLFAGASWLCWRAARASGREARRPDLFSWASLALAFFALNMQLDFDEAISEVGRLLARRTGVFALRHGLSLALVAVFATLVGALFALRLARDRRRGRGLELEEALTMAGCVVPAAWFALSSISHHDIGMLFDEMIWDALTLLGLVAVFWATTRVRPLVRRGQREL